MRLIDVDVAYEVLSEYYHHKTPIQHEALKEALEKVPAIDLVRCKDCQFSVYAKEFKETWCQGFRGQPTQVPDDWFCKDGIRKEK